VLDRRVSERVLFEDVIREKLDLGRPKQIQLILDRGVTKTTPGPFRTRVITDGVIPSLHRDYKGTHDALLAEETLQLLQRSCVIGGQRVAALRLADPLCRRSGGPCFCSNCFPLVSPTADCAVLRQLCGLPVEELMQGRMSYHLRRLGLHAMIERIPKSHRCRLTDFGFRTALFCTRA
jgi:hypothetical protein